MKTITDNINAKILISYFLVLLVVGVVLFFTVVFTVPGAYNRHMQMINSEMMNAGEHQSEGNWQGRGIGPGQPVGFYNFRDGVLESLGYAMVAAIFVAVIVSVFLSRQIVAPLRAMMGVSQRIADGRYDERVVVNGSDELAQLAERFNRMAERLEHTESMRRRLLADVSHELRTPLTAIGGYMEGLLDGVIPESPETYKQVWMEANRLSRLVDDLQELSRVEAGSYRLNFQKVKVSHLIETCVKRLSHQYAEKNVRLMVVPFSPSEMFQVFADEDRIIQVMTNLLSNALVYTDIGGEVTISVVKIGNEIQFTVQDNGIGISAENVPQIFDRFYRVDKSRSRSAGGGSGIGLTIAKALVEAHEGRIWAESAGEGMGSKLIFTIPMLK